MPLPPGLLLLLLSGATATAALPLEGSPTGPDSEMSFRQAIYQQITPRSFLRNLKNQNSTFQSHRLRKQLVDIQECGQSICRKRQE
nr:cortistatin isoform X3 [Macaca fascicularis]